MAGPMEDMVEPALPLIDAVTPYRVTPDDSLRHVIERINANAEGVALVLDALARLIGVITDGDVRRALLSGVELDSPISAVLATKIHTAPPITALDSDGVDWVLDLMDRFHIRHVPILDANQQVVGLALQSRFMRRENMPIQAVIMAGGLGTRLRPLTESIPKPMLAVAGRPLMEHIVASLSEVGIRNVNVTTHYLPEKITEHFGDGSRFNVDMHYVQENEPRGTAGALRRMETQGDTPILVINGDILTRVDFRQMLKFHTENKAAFTVGVHRYEFQVPYGVLDVDGPRITGLREKPRQNMLINAGVYLLEPRVISLIPPDRRFDMTDLIEMLIASGEMVAGFPIHEYWSDIGRMEDYFKAQFDLKGAPSA
jgi:dTDP-glucose pyrophosphorylase/CBS domain-containing protein